ncbi:hypothetical protein GVAV_000463 [Gurleya vavrai]
MVLNNDKESFINSELDSYCNFAYLNYLSLNKKIKIENELFVLNYLDMFIKNCNVPCDVLFLFLKKVFQDDLENKKSRYTLIFKKVLLFVTGRYLIEMELIFEVKFFILLCKVGEKIESLFDACFWIFEKACDRNNLDSEEIKALMGKIRVLYYKKRSKVLLRILKKWVRNDANETLEFMHSVDNVRGKISAEEIGMSEFYGNIDIKYDCRRDEEKFEILSGIDRIYAHSMKSSLNMQTFCEKRKSRISKLGFTFFKQ